MPILSPNWREICFAWSIFSITIPVTYIAKGITSSIPVSYFTIPACREMAQGP